MEEAWRHYAADITAGIPQASGGHTTAEWGDEQDWGCLRSELTDGRQTITPLRGGMAYLLALALFVHSMQYGTTQ